MKLKAKDFRAKPGEPVDLSAWPTHVAAPFKTKAQWRAMLSRHAETLSGMQEKLFASRQYALLIILQGMDSAGKDGVIRHVMSGINPQGCDVSSFKAPTEEEHLHDFLWRAVKALPARGMIGIFNRSYYEEVLVVRVHPGDLAAEGDSPKGAAHRKYWRDRYRSITELEAHLHRNGTRIVKIFLHLSKDEQRRRFLARIDEPVKNWKLSLADISERKFWKPYQRAYEACIAGSGSKDCPWHIVPADDKPTERLIVSQIILEAMQDLDLQFPRSTQAHTEELLAYRDQLLA